MTLFLSRIKLYICYLKTVFLILLLIVFGSAANGQYKAVAPNIQLEIGPTLPIPIREHLLGVKGGAKFYIGRAGYYFGIDGLYAQGYSNYTWPNVGNYRYNTTFRLLSPLVGYTFFRTEPYNLRLNLKCNFMKSESQLATESPTLRNYLIEKYDFTHTNLGGSLHFLYRATPNLGYFAELTYLKTAKENEKLVIGFGLTYNILNAH